MENLCDVAQVRHFFASIHQTGEPDRHIFAPEEQALRPDQKNLDWYRKEKFYDE